MQPQTQSPQMDNDAINLAKAIRQTESGGDFNAKGKSGESGAYQWMPQTWKKQAQEVLGDANAPMTPANQNAVAYTTIKKLKDQGLNPAQIAATWNSGTSTGWEHKVGTNSAGVHYDVPKYVKSVTEAYQTIKNGGDVSVDANNPSSIASTQNAPQQNTSLPNKIANALGFGGTVNTLADYIAKAEHPELSKYIETPTAGQNVGAALQLGSLALPLGGIARVGAAALEPAIGTGLARLGGGALAGATAGYAQDIASKLENKQPVSEALTPGAGTAIGAVTGGILNRPLRGIGQEQGQRVEQAVQNVANAYEKAIPLTPTQRIAEQQKLRQGGQNLFTTLARYGVNPASEDALTHLGDINQKFSSAIKNAAQNEHTLFNLTQIRNDAIESINKALSSETERQTAIAKLDKELQSLQSGNSSLFQKNAQGETIVPSQIVERLRQTGNSWAQYNKFNPKVIKNATGNALANAVRDTVEKDGSFPAYREANKEWGNIIDAQKTLQKIQDSGKTFRRVGGISGAIAEKLLAGTIGYHSAGLGGTILGLLGEDYASRILSNPSLRTYFDRQIIGMGESKSPAVLEKLAKQIQEYVDKKEGQLLLPPASEAGTAVNPRLLPTPQRESSVTAVPAKKGLVGVNPKTKKFMQTFLSVPNE